MFGMGGSEIIVILIVALLFLGPDKLPGAAKSISKGIRDIKKQSRALQSQIENDEQIGGAIRDLKSALRGDELHEAPKPRKPTIKKDIVASDVAAITGAADATTAVPALAVGLPTDENSILDRQLEVQASAAAPDLDVSGRSLEDAEPAATPAEPPRIKLPALAGEPGDVADPGGDDDLASLIKPAPGSVPKGS